MEINNKNIRGLYLYKDNINYNKGDFVVEDSTIYVVKKDVSNISPSKDITKSYYSIYLKDQFATKEDFINYSTMKNSDDKLVSSKVVSEILNSIISGFNEKGLVDNYITKEGDIYIKNICISSQIKPEDSYTNPLDKILVTKDLNNCIFAVSRNVVKSLLGTSTTNTNYVLLRQYTYLDTFNKGEEILIRIQELIDEVTGIVYYRYSKSIDQFEPKDKWNSTFIESNFKNRVDQVINYYLSEINKNRAELESIKNQFCFKEINFSLNDSSASFELINDNMSVITISLYKLDNNSDIRSYYSMSINLKSLNKYKELSLKTIDEDIIKISKDSNRYTIQLGKLKLDNLYGRLQFKDNN